MASIEGTQVRRKHMTYGKPARKKISNYLLDDPRKRPQDVFDSDSSSAALPASNGRAQNVTYCGIAFTEGRKPPSSEASVVQNREYIQHITSNPNENSRCSTSQEQNLE